MLRFILRAIYAYLRRQLCLFTCHIDIFALPPPPLRHECRYYKIIAAMIRYFIYYFRHIRHGHAITIRLLRYIRRHMRAYAAIRRVFTL